MASLGRWRPVWSSRRYCAASTGVSNSLNTAGRGGHSLGADDASIVPVLSIFDSFFSHVQTNPLCFPFGLKDRLLGMLPWEPCGVAVGFRSASALSIQFVPAT